METIDELTTAALLDGRYRVGECIGRGGTAVVYRAEDVVLGRTVALKVLRTADDALTDLQRIQSETAVVASLNHPTLVTLYDARLDPEHTRYMAMEFIDGPTLATRLQHGPLPGTEAADLARDLAEALHVVHQAGIIHRDVKPSNVLLGPPLRPGSTWAAKLTDFGIACGLDDARRTAPGIAIGTAAYMAPEQVRSSELTPAADVYSLGLVLLEALTGESAFPVRGGVQTAIRRLSDPPVVPDSLGADWVALLTRMTRMTPEERPSAHEVACAAYALRDDRSPNDVPSRRQAVLAPAAEDVTGPTQEIDSPDARSALRRSGRRMRVGALSVMCATAASMIVLGGVWGSAGPAESPGRAVTRTPIISESEPPAAETDTSEDPATVNDEDSSTGDRSTAGTPESDTGPAKDNPNKGPGNNSGKEKGPPDDGKKN
ncbi:serine/threonine-protein kinase [Microbacterium abyssi]|uniref:serine/threonine-protein kinase n=1 Tax=Microbacterium abyssi TaxID=2782166 RepID=UPI001889822E|nr:serine/threonine-protein kinase [Microbacterium sp. A18JL241]